MINLDIGSLAVLENTLNKHLDIPCLKKSHNISYRMTVIVQARIIRWRGSAVRMTERLSSIPDCDHEYL